MLVKNKHLTTIWYEQETDKVKILSALIYLNIAPLHGYPYNEFLFYYGKLNLIKLLKKS